MEMFVFFIIIIYFTKKANINANRDRCFAALFFPDWLDCIGWKRMYLSRRSKR